MIVCLSHTDDASFSTTTQTLSIRWRLLPRINVSQQSLLGALVLALHGCGYRFHAARFAFIQRPYSELSTHSYRYTRLLSQNYRCLWYTIDEDVSYAVNERCYKILECTDLNLHTFFDFRLETDIVQVWCVKHHLRWTQNRSHTMNWTLMWKRSTTWRTVNTEAQELGTCWNPEHVRL